MLPDLFKAFEGVFAGFFGHTEGGGLVFDGDAALEGGEGGGEGGEAVVIVGKVDINLVGFASFGGWEIADLAFKSSEEGLFREESSAFFVLVQFDVDGFLFIVEESVGAFDAVGDGLVGFEQGFIDEHGATADEGDDGDTESVGSNVCEHQAFGVLDESSDLCSFDGSAKRDSEVGMDIGFGFFSKEG